MEEMPADLYEEWCLFFMMEPAGWKAMNLVTTRLGYLIFQSQSKRLLKESRFEIKIGTGVHDDNVGRKRWEAMSLRSAVAANVARLAAGESVEEVLGLGSAEDEYLAMLAEDEAKESERLLN